VNDAGHEAIVDTDRAELRSRIDDACQRFCRLARSADPDARRPGLEWTVQQVVAHVFSLAHRYEAIAEGRDVRRADRARELGKIYQDALERVMAPLPELVDQLEAFAPVLNSCFDTMPSDARYEYQCNAMCSGLVLQVLWLGEIVLHGEDIARSTGVPWDISERDMLLYHLVPVELAHSLLREDLAKSTDISVALEVRGARPYVIHIHDGILDMRPRRPGDRPDAVVMAPASTSIKLLMNRIGPIGATRHGLRIVGGRRPWKAMKLQSCFETA
jgi:uncharacterized protein (TIGR03083 family)